MPFLRTRKWLIGVSAVRVLRRGETFAPNAHSPGIETFHDGSFLAVVRVVGRFGLCFYRHRNAKPETVGERGTW